MPVPHRWLTFSVILLAAMVLTSCGDEAVAPRTQSGPFLVPPDQVAETVSGRTAQGLAVALRDAGLRQKLLGDFRSSPYVDHALPLVDYLRSEQGAPLSRAAASALGMEDEAFEQELLELDGYRISVPIAMDRVHWTGEADVIVAASDLARSELPFEGHSVGYTLEGTHESVPNAQRIGPTLIYLEPAATDWSSEAAFRVEGAGDPGTKTISDFYSEIIPPAPTRMDQADESLDPLVAGDIISVIGGRKQAYRYNCTTLRLFTRDPSIDADHDGLRDTCEEFFMTEFHPVLNFHANEPCGSRETHWAVHEDASGWIAVIYLLAYHEDCGSIRVGYDWSHHAGDSEFVIAFLAPNGYYWVMDHLYTSAHYHTLANRSESNAWTDLDYTSDGLPYVFVSGGKHANYRSESWCNIYPPDVCDGTSDPMEWASLTSTHDNIGTYEYPFDLDPLEGSPSCTRSRLIKYHGVECFLLDQDFQGWQTGVGTHAQNYKSILEDFGLAHKVYPVTGGGFACPGGDLDGDGRIDPC